MNRQLMPALRVAVLTAGVAAAAVLGGGAATGAAAAVANPHTAAHAAACATSQLKIWYGEPTGASGGTSYVPFEFSNIGATACTLRGFPGVSAVNAAGTQLGSSASWGSEIPARTVVLSPRGTAHVELVVAVVENYPTEVCEPTDAAGLRFYPPNQTASVVVPFAFKACAKTGPTYLSVDVVNAGTGIPQYSNN